MTYIKIRNWDAFQHYKDRNPLWIKLYRSLLDNYEFAKLTDSAKGHLCCLWLLAATLDNKIPDDAEWIRKRIGASTEVDLDSLKTLGFVESYQVASKVLATCYQDASKLLDRDRGETEERREEKRRRDICVSGEGENNNPPPQPTPKPIKHPHGEFQRVKLTIDEYAKLKAKHGDKADRAIAMLDAWLESTGKRRKSHYACMSDGSWVWERLAEVAANGKPNGQKLTMWELNQKRDTLKAKMRRHANSDQPADIKARKQILGQIKAIDQQISAFGE